MLKRERVGEIRRVFYKYSMRWQEIIEGDVVNLGQFRKEKPIKDYADSVQRIYQGEASFFATGKFLPFAQSYIESNFDKEYAPVFFIDVSFRDAKLSPAAKECLAMLRQRRFKIHRTKEGPWARKEGVSYQEARQAFEERQNSPYGAYQPSRAGFRSSYVNNFNDAGIGFNIAVMGMDSRRAQPRQEDHIIDSEKDMTEVSEMMAQIERAKFKTV